MKTSTQLKASVRNLSTAKKVEAEIILRNFMLERFLERISVSKFKGKFILKGGMLIAAMVGIDTRTTMDMDATIKGQDLTEADLQFLYLIVFHNQIYYFPSSLTSLEIFSILH